MLYQSFLSLASVAAAASSLERRQSDDDYNWSRNDVLGLPDKVQAGEETTFRFNFSDATPRHIFSESGYRKVQVLLSRYLDKDEGRAQVWCVLEPCVLPNVSSIRTTIPKDVLPDSKEMMLKTRAFDIPSQDDPMAFNYTSFISDHLDYELQGSDAELSEWEEENGWEILGRSLLSMTCDKVPCVRSCVEEHLDIDAGNSDWKQDDYDEFRECTTECGVKEEPDLEDFDVECISENDAASSSSNGGSNGGSGSSGTDGDDDGGEESNEDDSSGSDGNSDGDDGDDNEDSATRFGGVSAGWLLGGLVAWAMLVL